jgi:hypothetical protein
VTPTPIPQRTHELLEALDRAVVTLPRMLQSTAVAAVIAFRPLLYTAVFWLVALKRKLLDELEEVPKLPPGAVVLAHMGRSGHPAEKPVPLLARLLQIAAPAGGHVLDPFAGRASAGIAALTRGYHYTGIESDPHHHAAAVKRLAEPVARELLPGPGTPPDALPPDPPTPRELPLLEDTP